MILAGHKCFSGRECEREVFLKLSRTGVGEAVLHLQLGEARWALYEMALKHAWVYKVQQTKFISNF